jgi:hypothetical protein
MKFSFAHYSHELIIFMFIITEFYCIYQGILIIPHTNPNDGDRASL